MDIDDKMTEWLYALSKGSYAAFESLYDFYGGKLYNFIMKISSGDKYLAEEVVQQTFIRIWEVKEKINAEKNFSSYLCVIAKNILMNTYERRMVEFIYTSYLYEKGEDKEKCTEESTDLKFLNDYIDTLIDNLPPSRKKIFCLSKRQHYSNKEIARIMNISESTVATQLSLAIKYMRIQFDKHYGKLFFILWVCLVNEIQ